MLQHPGFNLIQIELYPITGTQVNFPGHGSQHFLEETIQGHYLQLVVIEEDILSEPLGLLLHLFAWVGGVIQGIAYSLQVVGCLRIGGQKLQLSKNTHFHFDGGLIGKGYRKDSFPGIRGFECE